jgi:hypothetical protein
MVTPDTAASISRLSIALRDGRWLAAVRDRIAGSLGE